MTTGEETFMQIETQQRHHHPKKPKRYLKIQLQKTQLCISASWGGGGKLIVMFFHELLLLSYPYVKRGIVLNLFVLDAFQVDSPER